MGYTECKVKDVQASAYIFGYRKEERQEEMSWKYIQVFKHIM